MKVLLFSNDLMPFGQLPTSGSGARAWQLYCGLRARGVEVIASMPESADLIEQNRQQIPEEQREYLWKFGTQGEILKKVKPDAVLFTSSWDHYDLSGALDVPLILDLHGPRFLPLGRSQQPLSADKKVEVLSKADCLLVPGQRQRLYYSGWLLQAGRVPEDEHFLRVVPISLNPHRLLRGTLSEEEAPRFVSVGGWLPSRNQADLIVAVAESIARRNQGGMEIYGGPNEQSGHEQLGRGSEEEKICHAFTKVKAVASVSSRVIIRGWCGEHDLLPPTVRATVALEALSCTVEQELASAARTIEYLGCGVPVVYSSWGEVAEHIREYEAGWLINSAEVGEIRGVIDQIFSSPEEVRRRGRNAERLMQDRFTWDQTIEPLIQFLSSPKKAHPVTPVLGEVVPQLSCLTVCGRRQEVKVAQQSLESRFILPADRLIGIEVPYRLLTAVKADDQSVISFTLRRVGSRSCAAASYLLSTLSEQGVFRLPLPFWRRFRGGDRLALTIEVCGGRREAPIALTALSEVRYPFESGSLALALSFVPDTASSLYSLRMTAKRAFKLLREGRFKRVFRAVRRRVREGGRKVLLALSRRKHEGESLVGEEG